CNHGPSRRASHCNTDEDHHTTSPTPPPPPRTLPPKITPHHLQTFTRPRSSPQNLTPAQMIDVPSAWSFTTASCSAPPTPAPGLTLTLMNDAAAPAAPPPTPVPAAVHLAGSTGPMGFFANRSTSSPSLSESGSATAPGSPPCPSTSRNVASNAARAAAAFSSSSFTLASSACF
ncbi:hypothetical protein M758_8G002200, partial [Ceratodon purpureus]